MRVWKLQFGLENYDWLAFEDSDFDTLRSLDGRSVRDAWRPLRVKRLYEGKYSNAPRFVSNIPVFDRRAVNVLQESISDAAEILPLVSADGEFYAINVTQVLDCIDYTASEYETFSDGRIMRFVQYAFVENAVQRKHFFKIIDETMRSPFVSDEFRDRVLQSGLTGFNFKLVWES